MAAGGVFQASLSPATLPGSCWGIPRRSQARWDINPSSKFWVHRRVSSQLDVPQKTTKGRLLTYWTFFFLDLLTIRPWQSIETTEGSGIWLESYKELGWHMKSSVVPTTSQPILGYKVHTNLHFHCIFTLWKRNNVHFMSVGQNDPGKIVNPTSPNVLEPHHKLVSLSL